MKKELLIALFLAAAPMAKAQEPGLLWMKQVGGPYYEMTGGIVTDTNGNIYATGDFSTTTDFDPDEGTFNLVGQSGYDAFISKSGSDGHLIWAKMLSGDMDSMGLDIGLDAVGNIYTFGSFMKTVDFNPGPATFNITSTPTPFGPGVDLYISKLTPTGNFAWAKTIKSAAAKSAVKFAVDPAGNSYLTGFFRETADFDPSTAEYPLTANGIDDVFVSKLDSGGNLLWAKKIGGTGYDRAWGLVIDAAGNSYITGYFAGTADFDPGDGVHNLVAHSSGTDNFILKLDSAGNFVWAYNFGGTDFGSSLALAVDAAGNVYTTGHYAGTLDFDPGAGVFNVTAPALGSHGYLNKISPEGNLVWVRTITSAEGNAITISPAGDVYVAGTFRGTTDFSNGAGTAMRTALGEDDIFLGKWNAAGDLQWLKAIGGASDEQIFSLTVDASDTVLATGIFKGTVDFDSGPEEWNATSTGTNSDMFTLKIGFPDLGTGDNLLENQISLYPNPSTGEVHIRIPEAFRGADVSVYTILGQRLRSFTLDALNVSQNFPQGFYLMEITKDGRKVVKKFVVK